MTRTNSDFRLALVGAGRMGRNHLRALAGSDRVAVTQVVEPVAAARAALAADGFEVHATVEDLLAGTVPDGLLVTAPTGRHAEIVRAAVKAGVPVLCEKPAGLTSAEVREAGEAARAAGVVVQVAYWRRFVPALQRLRDRIADGGFGDVHLVACAQWDGEPPAASFRSGSGGIFVDMGVHEFDQLRWLTGQDVAGLSAAASTAVSDPAVRGDVDSAQALLRLSGGSTGLVSLGCHYPGGDMAAVEVFGSRGHERTMFLDPADGDLAMDDALRRQAEAFAGSVHSGPRPGDRPGAGFDDAVAALEAAENASRLISVPARNGENINFS